MKIDPSDNSTRAERIFTTIWSEYDDADPQTAVRDVLADLRHLCDLMGWDMAEIDREARQMYLRELRDSNGPAKNDALRETIEKKAD